MSTNTELLDEIERLQTVMLECADVLNAKAAPDLDPVGVRLREVAWVSRDRTASKHPWVHLTRLGERCKEAAAKLG